MSEDKNNTSQEQHEVHIKYLKSNFFRVVHANGVIGGMSGRGEIHIGFYSERVEFPDAGTIKVTQEGIVTNEELEGSSGHVREIEVDAVIDLGTARQLRDWLDNHITTMESLIKKSRKEAKARVDEITIPEG